MSADLTRVPVIVGAGQVTNRDEDPLSAPDPFSLMQQAVQQSIRGIGSSVAGEISHLWMVHSLSVRHADPAGYLADLLGFGKAEARCSGMGGSVPQWLVNRACELVVSGERPRVLIVGGEALATRRRAKREGLRLDWPSSQGWPETWPAIEPDLGVHPLERAHGLEQATAMYALVESALMHEAGDTPETHRDKVGALMEKLNEVAAGNPYSWFPARRWARELMEVTSDNRLIYLPYPKYVNAVMDVDMSAAVVLTDAATAREWGLAPDEVAYVAGWADAHDIWYLCQRPAVSRSLALARCAEEALGTAGLSADEITEFDLYSCFPSSIEVARDSIGIAPGDPRPLTLTGGLPYHGGPGSNYVTHALCNSFERIREGRSHSVLVHGNGYYLTKHAIGVYTADMPQTSGMRRTPGDLQERIDASQSAIKIDGSPEGPGSVVAYTARFSREGNAEPAVVLVDVSGRRTLARAQPELTATLLTEDAVGRQVTLIPGPEGNSAHLA